MEADNEMEVSSINDRVILAPMVRGSELAFRTMVRNHGVTTACYSPMLRANEIVKAFKSWKEQQPRQEQHSKTSSILSTSENDTFCFSPNLYKDQQHNDDGILLLQDIMIDTKPLVVQVCGSSPEMLYQATQVLMELNNSINDENIAFPCCCRIEGIDLNLGCPQKAAQQGNFGAYLADQQPDLAIACVSAMRQAIDDMSSELLHNHHQQPTKNTFLIPRLSCKIRLGENVNDTIKFCQNLERVGCDLIAVHCRRRDEKHHGLPDYSAGAAIVDSLTIPVVINGNAVTIRDVKEILIITKAHAVMVARGFLRNPLLLSTKRQDNDGHNKHTLNDIFTSNPAFLAASYLDCAELHPPPSPLYVRHHLRWFFRKEIQPAEKYPTDFDTNWKTRLWTFLVRPYLETIHQFRQIVALYVQHSNSPMPPSIATRVSEAVSFQIIRHKSFEILEEEDTHVDGGLALGLFD